MGRRQCELEGCTKLVQGGGTPHCKAHGGGKRCQHEWLLQVSTRRHALLHCARRGQAVPARGLPQVRSRRYATLHRARRGKALPARRLLQVCSRRYRALRIARRRQALPARGLPQGG
jgi:hypothetical protein